MMKTLFFGAAGLGACFVAALVLLILTILFVDFLTRDHGPNWFDF